MARGAIPPARWCPWPGRLRMVVSPPAFSGPVTQILEAHPVRLIRPGQIHVRESMTVTTSAPMPFSTRNLHC